MTEQEEHTLRMTALSQACHDFKGEGDTDRVIDRAYYYLQFLKTGKPLEVTPTP